MYKQTKYNRSHIEYNNCNSEGSHLIAFGAIISAIIYEEVQNNSYYLDSDSIMFS